MAPVEPLDESYEDKQHQAAYVFDPSDAAAGEGPRPAKRRRVSGKATGQKALQDTASIQAFPPLFSGVEDERCARLRQQLFEDAWSNIDMRIQRILREANHSTLRQVKCFLQDAPAQAPAGKVPSAFIVTGPNIASQDLLFQQLSETLSDQADASVVRLRSGDATNLKAALKKIIQTVTARQLTNEEDLEVAVTNDGRKFLHYDLEGLRVHLQSSPLHHVVVAFQDSEAFDSGLLSDLIPLLSTWLDRIPFAFLFGVATSVDLFEARLLKSTCQCLYGDQFDVEQSASTVDRIFKAAVAHLDAPLRLGPGLIGSLLERQHDQVVSIPLFVSSLKYAYMCHFYANPLTILLSHDLDMGLLQKEHLEAVRCLSSFRGAVEKMLATGDAQPIGLLLEDDEYLTTWLLARIQESRKWAAKLLRALKLLGAINEASVMSFSSLYLDSLSRGIDMSAQQADSHDLVKRMQPTDCINLLTRLLDIMNSGDHTLGLNPWAEEEQETVATLSAVLADIRQLQDDAKEQGHILRSRYSVQNQRVRTTIVAQKVQLSRDTAALTDEDQAYTELIDKLLSQLQSTLCTSSLEDLPLSELWLYDSKTPSRDVFIPRPRGVIERALSRPHDYLACACCKPQGGQILASFPGTAVLYQLYLEAGSLINAADLWSAYYAIMGGDNEDGLDERTALVLFYRALAEMRAMGFVKQSRRKADHIAKLGWKGL
ncbi:origin recognition complex subunit 3 N-terminus-domain-containing protein [Xylariaceae sp. FL0804]|nr:origin recognition complex subunit 3 N-terminus-domain-containing protein [Xylariaceae sp. FL0804]